jgi:hypothetical protein
MINVKKENRCNTDKPYAHPCMTTQEQSQVESFRDSSRDLFRESFRESFCDSCRDSSRDSRTCLRHTSRMSLTSGGLPVGVTGKNFCILYDDFSTMKHFALYLLLRTQV